MARESAEAKAQREAQEAADAALADAASDAPEAHVEGRSTKVAVDVEDGPLIFTRGADVVFEGSVKDGHVNAGSDEELAVLLSSVAGARVVD